MRSQHGTRTRKSTQPKRNMVTMMRYHQLPTGSPTRRHSMLDVSLAPKWRPRSASMSVVDVTKFSPQFTSGTGLMTRRPSPTPCTTPCFVSPRMAFSTQFAYDSPLQILSSGSPQALVKLKSKFGLKRLSRRWKIFLILVFSVLAGTLFLVRTLGDNVQTKQNPEITCAEDDLNCLNGDTSHGHPSFQRFLRAVSPPSQPTHYHSLSEDLNEPEVDALQSENIETKGLASNTIEEQSTGYASDPNSYLQRDAEFSENRMEESAYRKQRLQVVNGQYTERVQQSATRLYALNSEEPTRQTESVNDPQRYGTDSSSLVQEDFGSQPIVQGETASLDQHAAQVQYQGDTPQNIQDETPGNIVNNYEVNQNLRNTEWEGHENQARDETGEIKQWESSSQENPAPGNKDWERSTQDNSAPGSQGQWNRSPQDNSAPGSLGQWNASPQDNSGQGSQWNRSPQDNSASGSQGQWDRPHQGNPAPVNQALWDRANQENARPGNKAQWEGQPTDSRRYTNEPRHPQYDHQPRHIRRANEMRPQRLQEQHLQGRLQQQQQHYMNAMRVEDLVKDGQIYPQEGAESWRDARMQERFRVPPGVNPARYRRLEL
nr:uncharacterized protein LOC123768180 isoform X2 [Procambarus clarkii]